MFTIVTKLKLARPFDAEILRRIEQEFFARAKAHNPGFLGAQIVRVSETESIAISFFETQEALDDVSSKIAGPWFAENVRPYLGGPVERSVGEVVARFGT